MTLQPGEAPQSASSLADIVADLLERGAEIQLSVGPITPEWRPWSALVGDRNALREALLKEAEFNGLDAKGQAAYLIGTLAYYPTSIFVALRSAGLDVLGITAETLFYRHDLVTWQEGEESGQYNGMFFRVSDTLELRGPPCDIEALRVHIIALLEPVLQRIAAETGLGKPALWRQGADNVASAFLYTGRPLGFESAAIEEGWKLLRAPGSPLTNKQTGFFSITVADDRTGASVSDTWRARGGCCRAYTTGDGAYCSTCVLVPIQERDANFTAMLRERLCEGDPAQNASAS